MSSGSTIILKNNENVKFVTNPSITYFKSVYRKHTKFTIAYKEEEHSDNNTFQTNDSINFDLKFFGDLLCDVSLKVVIEDNSLQFGLKNDLPLFLVDDVTLTMVGPNIEIDKLDKNYINFNAMLNNPISNNATYKLDSNSGELTCCDGNNYQNMSLCGGVVNVFVEDNTVNVRKMTAVIPLPFAFCKSIGNAFPICALDVTHTHPRITLTRVNIDEEKFQFSVPDGGGTTNEDIIGLFKYSIISKYIFLSDEEKLRFKNSKQEYLYERVNVLNDGSAFTNTDSTGTQLSINRLSPNHPIKQIYLYNQIDEDPSPDFNKLKYNIFINSEQMFLSGFLNHEFFSKVEILNKFKGCIYNGSESPNVLIDNNIALIDFSLKNSVGPSGCISPNTNAINLHIKSDNSEGKFNIKIYVVCYYLLSISDERITYMFE